MKPKLYIKNEKGRYEEYIQEKTKDDPNLLYRRINGKYVPCSRMVANDLQEGIWVVLSNLSYKSRINGDYLKELFQVHKIGEIEPISIAQLGNLEMYYQYVIDEYTKYQEEYNKTHEYMMSSVELFHFIIGKVFEFSKQQELKNK